MKKSTGILAFFIACVIVCGSLFAAFLLGHLVGRPMEDKADKYERMYEDKLKKYAYIATSIPPNYNWSLLYSYQNFINYTYNSFTEEQLNESEFNNLTKGQIRDKYEWWWTHIANDPEVLQEQYDEAMEYRNKSISLREDYGLFIFLYHNDFVIIMWLLPFFMAAYAAVVLYFYAIDVESRIKQREEHG